MVEAGATPGRAYEWPLYQGTKQLKVNAMTKAAYCALRGWTVPADEDPAELGYCVEYQDGGKPNVDGFAGYVSWSPADVFEKAYRLCGTPLDRMRIEIDELNERLSKLRIFTIEQNPVFSVLNMADKALLVAQRDAMLAYSTILLARFALAADAANG